MLAPPWEVYPIPRDGLSSGPRPWGRTYVAGIPSTRIYAETSYRLLRGSTDASDENKDELIELLKTTKRQPIFGGKIEEAAAGPVKRMPGSRASRD